jgi:hypothetical protein
MNKTVNNKIRLIAFWGVVISLIGCKTKQTVLSATATEQNVQTETLVGKTDTLQCKRLNYNWITYRANVSIASFETKKENLNVVIFVVNRKDSIIYATLSKMGIEGARFVLTPDTVKFLNHLSSNYYVGDYALLDKLIGFKTNFYMMQSLLTGEDISEEAKSFLQANYGNFTNIDSQQFFQQADFVVEREDLWLSITVKNIKLNEAGPTSIRIPEKYTPIKY